MSNTIKQNRILVIYQYSPTPGGNKVIGRIVWYIKGEQVTARDIIDIEEKLITVSGCYNPIIINVIPLGD